MLLGVRIINVRIENQRSTHPLGYIESSQLYNALERTYRFSVSFDGVK